MAARPSALSSQPLHYDKPLCASLDGFTLHAATRARAWDTEGREALLRYVLRPPIAQDRLELRPEGLVRIVLKRAYSDGTTAVDMDPLSFLCRLAKTVPPPRRHTVKYAGVLGPAHRWRKRIRPRVQASSEPTIPRESDDTMPTGSRYRFWAELLMRTFGQDVLECPRCHGRMRLIARVTEPKSIVRFLEKVGEPTDVPGRSPCRGPAYFRSAVMRRKALGDCERRAKACREGAGLRAVTSLLQVGGEVPRLCRPFRRPRRDEMVKSAPSWAALGPPVFARMSLVSPTLCGGTLGRRSRRRD